MSCDHEKQRKGCKEDETYSTNNSSVQQCTITQSQDVLEAAAVPSTYKVQFVGGVEILPLEKKSLLNEMDLKR